MLYLEDYLEMIENLPQELRDRFTDMREMDLTVQNNIDTIEKRIRLLFGKCARSELTPTQADEEYKELHSEYDKILVDADEKIQLANQMYDLVDRYMRRLDSELFKFKCELEADHNGITEILEKRSLELEGGSGSGSGNGPGPDPRPGIPVSLNSSALANNTPNAGSQKENRFFGMLVNSNSNSNSNTPQNRERYRARPEKRRNSSTSTITMPPEKRPMLSTPSTSSIATSTLNASSSTPALTVSLPPSATAVSATPQTPAMPYNIQQQLTAVNAMGVTPNAAQTITTTPQMHPGRRASGMGHDLLMGRDMNATMTSPNASGIAGGLDREAFGLQRRHKKKIPGMHMPLPPSALGLKPIHDPSAAPLSMLANLNPGSPSVVLGENGLVAEQTTDSEWSYDPNEPRYCICNQVSYGDMVACDNEACPFEWFHYPCVGITQPPKGKWYCPKCTASMKRRGIRK